ncbi:MAG: DJ-1/PfpI family protein [Bacteroidales bacterium]|nr:DJ-1/PfpI family protein [Candidatus Cryptobacteroides aphodequi]
MKGINIFLADGFEDIEALAVNDALRRAGLKVRLVAISDEPFVVTSRRVTIGVEEFLADLDLSARGTDHNDVMIFPGGLDGSRNLAACKPLIKAMKEHYAAGGTLAAICAAPGLVLGQLDDLTGVDFTCFDGFEDKPVSKGARFVAAPAVRSGRIITGRSAGYALDFAFEIIRAVKDDQTAEKVRAAMLLPVE